MPTRGPFVQVLLGVAVVLAAALALVGGVALRASGVVAVLLAGAVAACLAAGVARETTGAAHLPAPEAAALAAGWTVGSLLVLSGTAALGGGLAAVLTGAAGAIVGLAVWLIRSPHPSRDMSPHTLTAEVAGAPAAAPMPAAPWHAATVGRFDPAGSARLSAPLTELPTAALGREWLLTTAALAGRLEPSARESIVRRRQEALDELERRDADGFARWLAAGPAPGSDPADFVHGEPASGRDA
ncbi:hypothetical protein [Petropleomorpha daqingensis]|uniref:Uncharacterized protein n=1 Tax=Petropleomorpha daqingensis TaxID=2026353 RepID=A0A853CE61_9ACTN|nr:hypothetical protein [Petropleomorpha daqingensis]NYJ06104.1 hypothetical protein [Petropleomorpha daqingensis]